MSERDVSEFVVAKFSDLSGARSASAALERQFDSTATVHASAVLHKDSRGRVSVYDRVERSGHAPAVAAFIGALAGLGVGALGAIAGAVGGALVGLTADSTKREARARLLETVSYEVRSNSAVLLADVAAADADDLRALIRNLGGTILDPADPSRPNTSL
jgi:uncharacterized membrane protein